MRSATIEIVLKSLKTYHNNGNIIHRLLFGSEPQYFIGTLAAYLMYRLIGVVLVLSHYVPDQLTYFLG